MSSDRTYLYEPWLPQEGMRVRILDHPECPAKHPPDEGMTGCILEISWGRGESLEEAEFQEEDLDLYDGLTLEEARAEHRAWNGHWYVVVYDHPLSDPVTPWAIKESLYAACELEAIE